MHGGGGGRLRNPCLTMHQPWASLLVHGIKRVEGRSWPSPLTGRLWIHAASKVPEAGTIKAMEEFYREIYALDGITNITFPHHYPVSRLLGCVEVVGCVTSQELASWEHVPQSVSTQPYPITTTCTFPIPIIFFTTCRLEALTDFCWLCENPQKLVVPFDMRGYQGVYNLERRIYEGAVRGLSPVQGPLPVNFPLPDPTNPLSLNPGSLQLHSSRSAALDKSPSVTAAIAGARAAATQYSRNNTAITSTPTEETRQRFSRENHADNTSGPSIVHDRSPVLQNQNLPSLALTNPPYLKNQTMPSFVQNNLPNLQNHNLSYLPHQNLSADVSNRRVSLLQNQSPSSLLHSGQSYLQNQNAEPRRSPRLQNEPPSRARLSNWWSSGGSDNLATRLDVELRVGHARW
uniref:ASCH domain-containing protein n=1 Tax=Oryza nivara TaxID=4536 RepID=A0A0E0FY21_ORYNI